MTDKHTPCENCNPDGVYVELCPLHAAAPEMLEALEVQEAYTTRLVTSHPPKSLRPKGHDCEWCGHCANRVSKLRRDAIKAAKGDA